MKTWKKFNPAEMAKDTKKNTRASRYFNSWLEVAKYLDRVGFNAYEAEVIMTSRLLQTAVNECGKPNSKNSHRHTIGHIEKYFVKHFITPRCSLLNKMVLEKNPDLKANEQGIPCHEGTMPGNPEGGKTLVPVGTPSCCNPHSETYWSM